MNRTLLVLVWVLAACESTTGPDPVSEPVWINASGYYVAEGRAELQVYLYDASADPKDFETFVIRHDERRASGFVTMWSGSYRASEDSLYFVPSGHSYPTWPKLSGANWSGRPAAFTATSTFGTLRLVRRGNSFPP